MRREKLTQLGWMHRHKRLTKALLTGSVSLGIAEVGTGAHETEPGVRGRSLWVDQGLEGGPTTQGLPCWKDRWLCLPVSHVATWDPL